MSAINDEHEQYNNLVFDLINTLRDCKATPSLLIDDAFNAQLDKLLRNIDENRRDDEFYSAATEEYRENLRAVVDGFSEKFPGSRVSDEVSVDDFCVMHAGQLIAEAMVNVDYAPYGFNAGVREMLSDAINVARLSKIPDEFVMWDSMEGDWREHSELVFLNLKPLKTVKVQRSTIERLQDWKSRLTRKI
jgi:hypothetical protein